MIQKAFHAWRGICVQEQFELSCYRIICIFRTLQVQISRDLETEIRWAAVLTLLGVIAFDWFRKCSQSIGLGWAIGENLISWPKFLTISRESFAELMWLVETEIFSFYKAILYRTTAGQIVAKRVCAYREKIRQNKEYLPKPPIRYRRASYLI